MNPLPFILLAISLPLLLGGCGDQFSDFKGGEMVTFAHKTSSGRENIRGAKDHRSMISDGRWWYVKRTGNSITFRNRYWWRPETQWIVIDKVWTKNEILWIKKREDRIPMPPLTD